MTPTANLLTGVTDAIDRVVIEDGQGEASIRRELPARDDGERADLDGRADLPPEPAESSPATYDAELAGTLTEIVWGALYLTPIGDLDGHQIVGVHRGTAHLGG